jgi:hypothetical protein
MTLPYRLSRKRGIYPRDSLEDSEQILELVARGKQNPDWYSVDNL